MVHIGRSLIDFREETMFFFLEKDRAMYSVELNPPLLSMRAAICWVSGENRVGKEKERSESCRAMAWGDDLDKLYRARSRLYRCRFLQVALSKRRGEKKRIS